MLNRPLALTLASILLIGCSQTSESPPVGLSSVVRPSCQLGPKEDPYFGGTLREDPDHGASAHYALLLFAMQEPSLACGRLADQSYRVLHSSLFAPEVQAIRIGHDGTRSLLTSVRITRSTDGSWPVTSRIEKELAQKDWDQFASVVGQLNLWSLTPLPQSRPGVLDGGTWILEGRSDGRYHAALRGDMKGGYAEVARALFLLAGLDLPDELRDRQ